MAAVTAPGPIPLSEEELTEIDHAIPIQACSAAVALAIAASTDDVVEAPWLKNS